jgi:phenolic acid decarboxylase
MIYSVLGSKVKQGALTVGNSIDCSELTAGVYIIRLTNPLGKQSSLKFVKV